MGIIVKEITKKYGDQKAIDKLSFRVNPDEIVGLIGPNGAGKTTTMKILTCYMLPDEGTAEIYGYDIRQQAGEIKKIIGYLPEHNPLYGEMYLKEYLRFVCKIHKLPNPAQRSAEVIEQVGLTPESHKKIGELSKGYKQRVGLAQAIIHDPKVLILDEPISGLDPNQLIEIRSLIRKLKKDRTIIFSSHILSEVESICDKVLILSQGRIIKDETLAGLNIEEGDQLVLHLELLNPVDPDKLLELDGVDRVEVVKDNTFLLRIGKDPVIRQHIFDRIVEMENKIMQMVVRQDSLENIFKSLTRTKRS